MIDGVRKWLEKELEKYGTKSVFSIAYRSALNEFTRLAYAPMEGKDNV